MVHAHRVGADGLQPRCCFEIGLGDRFRDQHHQGLSLPQGGLPFRGTEGRQSKVREAGTKLDQGGADQGGGRQEAGRHR